MTRANLTMLRDVALVRFIQIHGSWDNRQTNAPKVLPELNAMVPKEAQSWEFSDWSRRVNFDKWFFRKVATYTYVLAGSDYVPKMADGAGSEVISVLKKFLKSEGSTDWWIVKDWETTRSRFSGVSKEQIIEKLQEIASTMSDLDTADHYGAGGELQLCHIVGSSVLNDEDDELVRHGDVLFGDANKNQVESYFGAKGFGHCYLFEKEDGIYLKVPVGASKLFKLRWNGVLLVPTNRTVLVADKDGDEVPLFDLLINAVRVQLLVIKHKDVIARKLREKHTAKRGKIFQMAASVGKV